MFPNLVLGDPQTIQMWTTWQGAKMGTICRCPRIGWNAISNLKCKEWHVPGLTDILVPHKSREKLKRTRVPSAADGVQLWSSKAVCFGLTGGMVRDVSTTATALPSGRHTARKCISVSTGHLRSSQQKEVDEESPSFTCGLMVFCTLYWWKVKEVNTVFHAGL